MKLTVLLDNNTLIDRYFLGEPGVSYFIEVDGKKVLFDVGYSDAFIRNAQKLDINLLETDFVVLSHGHLDHTWGLVPLIQLYTEGSIEHRRMKFPALVAHPKVLGSKKEGDIPELGSILNESKLASFFDLKFSRAAQQISENLLFLGEIERSTDFEAREPVGLVIEDGQERGDDLLDDSAIVYQSPQGLVIITGCSHAGICNIVEYARQVTGEQRVVDIVGGFHLLNPAEKQLQGTIEYLQKVNPAAVHACHCTDLQSKIEMSRSLNIKEVGVGLVLEYKEIIHEKH
jgi:7,8-dihydropterin-6-yl-methyl-4-(beta-D-ribofuranosyl)aminobenzene 5'-phosphate synthase